MVSRVVYIVCGNLVVSVSFVGLLAQKWALLVNERAAELAEEIAAARESGSSSLQDLLDRERSEKAKLQSELNGVRRNFSKEIIVWAEVRRLLETERQEKATFVLQYEKLRTEWLEYTRQVQQPGPNADSRLKNWEQIAVEQDCKKHCAIADFSFAFDARFDERSAVLRAHLGGRKSLSFEQLYKLVVNKPWYAEDNVWRRFPNPYNMSPSFAFPYSNLRAEDLEHVFRLLSRPPSLVVEVGSFHGHSAIVTSQALDRHGFHETPLLCVDPWVGDLGELLFKEDWDKALTQEIADGRSTSYFQFMINIKSKIDAGEIGARHIIPLAVTSLVGARYLTALGLEPDIIYLDSAHEKDETFIEISFFYNLLADGGILFGDDFLWYSVSADVKRFAEKAALEVMLLGNCWLLQKRR